MDVKQKFLYSNVSYKINLIPYVKQYGNRAKQTFWFTSNRENGFNFFFKEEKLKLVSKDKKTFRQQLEKWPGLEVQVKKLGNKQTKDGNMYENLIFDVK